MAEYKVTVDECLIGETNIFRAEHKGADLHVIGYGLTEGQALVDCKAKLKGSLKPCLKPKTVMITL